MQIEGKDDDQADTINAKISYSIISQEPEGTGHMFTIDEKTGKLYVKESTLDRETYDFYKLVIKGSDMGGAAGGLTGTGTVEIKVLDINDNIPTLEKSEYSGSVDENVADVVVMRIKALDKDLEHTDNWLTVFTIAKGNEDNLFSIKTDKETNEGILTLIKPVDFEEVQNLELGLLIENVAPFVEGGVILMDVDVQVGEKDPLATGARAGAGVGAGVGSGIDLGVDGGLDAGVSTGVDVGLDANLQGGVNVGLDAGLGPGVGVKPGVEPGVSTGLKPGVKPGQGTKPKPDAPAKSYPIKIAVNNVPEGPVFIPDTKNVPVSEDPNAAPEDGVITVFAAVDPDTGKPAEDVSYAKAYDPDNWFTIDEETAVIKLNKVPDRESLFLVNGTYIGKILAITKDMPSKTATGTIAIQVTDSNDHCPTLTTTHSSLCSDGKTVYVTAFDEDVSPNAAPLTFRIIPDGTQGNWDVEVISETSAALHSQEALWPGSYELQVEVLDAQGLSCPAREVFTVDVCTCVETEDCSLKAARLGTTSSELSPPAIGLLLMAMSLLLFIPLLLLFCQCGGADTIFPDQFSDLPFDTKEHLISYHTEVRGEDKEVPLQSVPMILGTQKKVEMAPALNFNTIPSKITETHQATTIYDESVQKFQETGQSLMEVDNAYRFSIESFNHGNRSATFSRQTLGVQHMTAMYEDIALPDAFLNDYYSQKAVCVVPVKDGLLEYYFEGQGSPNGSVGCCSLLESDNDLQFLSDLGPKFTTLAEICSPPTPTPKPSLTCKVAAAVKTTDDIAEPVVKHKIERSVETKHSDIKTEKVMSSTNISKSSVNTLSTAPPSMTLPRSRVTNISHSSNIHYSATLPRQAQKQTVYYTTSPVLQPMNYVVQPQLQNMVLLADGIHEANFPGLYVVSGPQSPSSGLVINGPQASPSGLVIQGIESPESPASPSFPVSPTLLLPVSPGRSQGSVPMDGWKIIGPNPDGNYMLVKDKSSPGGAEGVDPGSSQGTLPRGAILVNKAATSQGVLGPAAQGSVYGILPGHTVAKNGDVVAVNRNLGQTWVGQPGQTGLGPVTVLGVGVEQSRMGMGHVVAVKPEVRQAGIWPAETSAVGIRQVSVTQFQGIPPLEQTADASGIPKTCIIVSPKEDKTINVVNTVITAETTKTHPSSKEEVMMKNLFKNDSDPNQNMHNDSAEEKQSEDVIAYTSEQDTTLDDEDPSEVVQSAFKDNEGIQENPTQTSEKSSIVNLEENIVKSLPGPAILRTSFEQSDTVVEKSGDTMDKIVPDQLNKITEAPTNKFTDVISQTRESNDPQENAEKEPKVPQSEQQENHVLSVDFSGKDISIVTKMSSTEAFLPGPHVTDLVNTDKETEETSTFPRGEEVTFTLDHIIDDQIHGGTEESVGRQKAAPLTEVEEIGKPVQLSIVEGPEDRGSEVGSQPQSNEVPEDQIVRELEKYVCPAKKVVSDLETHQVIATSDSIQAEENMEENTTITSDAHEEVTAKHKQLLDSEVGLNTVGDELSATPNKTSTNTVNESEERSILDLEALPELQVDHSEGDKIDKGHARIGVADAEAKTSLQTVSTILTIQEEGHLGDPNLISVSEKNTTQGQVEGSNVPTISTLEQHLHTANVSSSGHKEENHDNQQNVMSGSGVDKDQVNANVDSINDGEKENIIVEEGVSQGSFSTSNDQDEDTERQDALSTSSQIEDKFISDDNITDEEKDEDAVEEMVSLVQQVDDTLFSDDDINVPENEEKIVEVVALPVQQNVSITDDQDEEIEREAASGRLSPLEDQLISEDNIRDGAKEVSPVQQMTSISDEAEDSEKEDSSHTVEVKLISDDSVSDGEKEENAAPSKQQNIGLSDDQDEESKKEDAPGTSSQSKDQLVCLDNIHDGEKEEDIEMSPLQQNICIPDDQDVANAKEDTSGTSSYIVEDGIKFDQMLKEDSQPLETECLFEEDLHLASQQLEMNQVVATLKVETQEMPCEVTIYQVRQGIDSSQIGDVTLDISERQYTVGHELVRGANMEGLDDVVTSSEELRSSRVATGQVCMYSEDKGASGSILASGQVAEGETTQSDNQNTDVIKIDWSEGGDLTLEKGKAEVTFELEIRERLDDASGQVSLTSFSEIKVVDRTTSLVLETDPGSAETGTASFITASEVAKEAGYLVQNESLSMTGEATGIGPDTVGKAGSTEVVSKASDYMHGAEVSGGQVSPVQLQTVISQSPPNKSRNSKKNKSPQSPKSPSGKCKQQ
ncbi:uncharacterized protein LOC122877664 isoform X2 [Siniperca chuatsi]|nr:uncharacterized protein LOC122877664 isoform X2 [Siniperca chuatsi]